MEEERGREGTEKVKRARSADQEAEGFAWKVVTGVDMGRAKLRSSSVVEEVEESSSSPKGEGAEVEEEERASREVGLEK